VENVQTYIASLNFGYRSRCMADGVRVLGALGRPHRLLLSVDLFEKFYSYQCLISSAPISMLRGFSGTFSRIREFRSV
jgi:hypothetical protein